jgi:hypothetical protein
MATVNLKDLRGHLGDAAKLCEAAFQSDEEQPELDFEKVRTSLRAALGLLAEGSGGSGGGVKNGATDSARERGNRVLCNVGDVWPALDPYRNHAS